MKISTSTTSNINAEVRDNVVGTYNFVQLCPTQQSAKFLLILSNDI